jgi:autotransporter-associated beta strand protein
MKHITPKHEPKPSIQPRQAVVGGSHPARPILLVWLAALLLGLSPAHALNYEVYPGAAYFMTQMVSSVSFPYTAQFASGFYYNSWAFGYNSDTVLSTQQKQAICNNFSNRFAMVEDNQGDNGPNICITDINTMRGLGMKPVASFINQPADPFVWAQTVAKNGALNTPSYEMLPPWWVGQGSGWSGWTKQQTNMLVWGCCGSGVDSPVNLYFSGNGISASAYQKAVWDQCKWSHAVGKKFNYLASPNTDTGQQFLTDMQRVTRSLEDNGAEPDVYGVELYGIRPVDLVPETTTNNGVVQANWTITGLAFYLLKHRDGDPGTLSMYATSNGVNYAQSVISPILTSPDQIIPFNPAQANQFTLTLTNLSAWLDYTAVLRARTAQAANWNITFKIGTTDITGSVLNKSGYVFLSSKRLLPNTAQQVTVTLSPKIIGIPTPLDLVIEALPHAGVDQAMDVIAFQYETNQSPPTLNFPTNDWFTLQGMAIAPIWFTVGDAETISTQLTVTAASGQTTLMAYSRIVFGQSGIQRWVTISPATSQWGSTPVTLIVSDGQFSASNTFNVFVQQTNTTPYVKANNTVNLELANSWVTNAVPDEFGVAVWDSTVTTANPTTLGDDEGWAGIQIKNPGGAVTINGTNTLSLGDAGVNMGAASQNFTMNCQAVLGADVNCNIASGRVATMNGVLSSLGNITKNGAGLLVLSGSNTYSGGTVITGTSGSKNPLLASNSLALGTGAVTIGGGGNNDAACLQLAGGITLANNLGTWLSRNTTAPNILNVSGTNTVAHSISAGNGGGQSTLQSDSGDLIMKSSITTRQLNLQGAGSGELRGVVDTSGYNLVMNGPGIWTMSANNTYSGGTIINGGTLVIKGKNTGTGAVTVNAGGILAGSGTIPGAVSVPSGGSLAPGAGATSAGTVLTISNSLTLLAGSTNVFKLNASANTNDSVRGLSSAKYGGTLQVTNLAGTLTTNNAYKLFYATSYSGTFASLSPANPGAGLFWDTSTLATDGTLRITGTSVVSAQAGISFLDVNGTNAGFGGTNGSVAASGNFWTTDINGVAAPGSFVLTNVMQIGNVPSDFNGSILILTNDITSNMTGAGLYIVGTNMDLTLAGSINAHWSTPCTWSVAPGSTMHVTVSVGSNHGWNFNRQACTLSGGGVFDFVSAFAANAGLVTENMGGAGTVLLEQTTTSNFGATNSNQPTLSAGFTLASGNFYFVSPQSLADTFQAFAGATNIFTINGGTIDNLTGAAGAINLGNGAYTIGDDFTFAGSSSLSLGNNPVIVSNGTPTITVSSNTLTIGGTITSTFGLAKNGGGTLAISGSATLPQGIQVNEGTLLANGIIGPANSTGIFINGGVLGGTGTLLGAVTIQPNGMLTPGVNGISTLTISNNLTCQSGSTSWFEINVATATKDLVCGLQTVTFGGTLVVTNLGGTLMAGDSFRLFVARNYVGSFDNLVMPALDASLTWSNRLALDGTILVVANAPVSAPQLTSVLTFTNTLQFNWANNGALFHLQSQTNPPAAGLGTNWFDYPGGDTPPVNVPINNVGGSTFFRLKTP